MNYVRIALYVGVAVLVALLAGFLWGRSGKPALQQQLARTELRLDLAQARGDLLAARVDLFEVNFGRASQQLQAARTTLQRATTMLGEQNRADDAARVKTVSAGVAQAQDQASRLDQSANTGLAAAVTALDQVMAAGK